MWILNDVLEVFPGESAVSNESGSYSPMKPAEFHILLVLAGDPLHGLGIAKAIDEATAGAVRLGPGTLYRALKELEGGSLIEEIGAPAGEADPRRRFYQITAEGLLRARGEAERLAKLVEVAHKNAVLPRAS